MPLYKNHPRNRSQELPFYRPIDRLFYAAWDHRKALVPYAVLVMALAFVYLGLRYYQDVYDRRASTLLEQGHAAEVAERYGRSEAALVARMQLASKALDEKRWDDAVTLFADTVSRAQSFPMIRLAALQNEALALLKKGDYEQALRLLDRAVKDPQNAIPDYTRLLVARTYEMKGDLEKAQEAYKGLAAEGIKPYVQAEAKERLSWFESKN